MDSWTILQGITAALIVLPIAVAICVRYAWASLVLFWILPVVKLWLLEYVPAVEYLDPTLITGGLVVVVMAVTQLRCHAAPPIDWPLVALHLALGALMTLTYLWTTAPDYGFYKMLRFLLFS